MMNSNELIDARIKDLGDWRGEMLAGLRKLIHEADPEVKEDVKWIKPSNPWGVPTWEHAGIICTGEVYKDKVKLTFAKGSLISDPTKIFNASLEGSRRALDLFEGAKIDEDAFRGLINSAVAVNIAKNKK